MNRRPPATSLAACALVAAFLARPAAAACPARPTPPASALPSAAERVRAARPVEAAALDAYAFPPDAPGRRGIRTDGLVVVHRGIVTYERYARGFDATSRHVAWSVTKTLTGVLAAVAVAEGAIGLDDSVCKHLGARAAGHCGISVRHLLEWSSGLDWEEGYEGSAHQASSVLAMLYGVGSADMAAFVLGHRARAAPGQVWRYSSGDAVLLAAVLGAAMEPRHGRDWPWTRLLDRIGVGGAVLERDAAGTLVGSSYLFATPRELARLGMLLLDDGCAGGERILPEGWMRDASQPSAPLRRGSAVRERGDVAGRSLWLNRRIPELGEPRPWPDAPEDAIAARGHWGQLVAVIPSLELVIVRTGDDREPGATDPDRLLALAIAAGRLP